MSSVLQHIKNSHRAIAVLLDPEKIDGSQQEAYVTHCKNQFEQWKEQLDIDYCCFFIGGSTMNIDMDAWLLRFKKVTDIPIVIFPGSYEQVSENADALLFLNLVSGRNPEFLIENQVRAAAHLIHTDLEVIPTGYLLIDGGVTSAVERETLTKPISQEDKSQIVHTAYAAQLMGNQLIYLEAGSGAIHPVKESVVAAVNNQLDIPVIVGGGLRITSQIEAVFYAGASMVVVGTAIENELL